MGCTPIFCCEKKAHRSIINCYKKHLTQHRKIIFKRTCNQVIFDHFDHSNFLTDM